MSYRSILAGTLTIGFALINGEIKNEKYRLKRIVYAFVDFRVS